MTKKFQWLQPSEKEIESAILEYLNYQVGCFAFKVNTMGVYDQRGGFYRKPNKYQLSGTPDVLCCYSVHGIGVFIGFEVKAERGRQSSPQKEFQARLEERSDGFYFVVKSIKDVENALLHVNLRVLDRLANISK